MFVQVQILAGRNPMGQRKPMWRDISLERDSPDTGERKVAICSGGSRALRHCGGSSACWEYFPDSLSPHWSWPQD